MKTTLRHAILLLAGMTGLLSCSPRIYRQVATVESSTVKMKEDGAFRYDTPEYSICYDFWTANGHFSFTIVNNSNEDLKLDLTKSHFVCGNQTYDYYEGLTYTIASRTVLPEISVLNNWVTTAGTAGTISDPVVKIEKPERKKVCIPAHSSRTFHKFAVAELPFRQCGLLRTPGKRKDAVKTYTSADSPTRFKNILTFSRKGEDEQVINSFYISEYRNLVDKKAYIDVRQKKCDGSGYEVRVCKFFAANRFYILYNEDQMKLEENFDDDHVRKSR